MGHAIIVARRGHRPLRSPEACRVTQAHPRKATDVRGRSLPGRRSVNRPPISMLRIESFALEIAATGGELAERSVPTIAHRFAEGDLPDDATCVWGLYARARCRSSRSGAQRLVHVMDEVSFRARPIGPRLNRGATSKDCGARGCPSHTGGALGGGGRTVRGVLERRPERGAMRGARAR
jgi:hypothetical protein